MTSGARGATVLLAVAAAGAPSCGSDPRPPTRAQAEELMRALDDAFNRGSSADYAALFAVTPSLGPAFERARRMVAHDERLRQSTEIDDYLTLGEGADRVGVAMVTTTLSCSGATQVAPRPTPMQSCIAFRDAGDGVRVLLYEDADGDVWKRFSDRRTGQFYCPPCNFRIGHAALRDWLVVPSPRRIHGCVEMVSFYRPGDDIRLTLSVHRAPRQAFALDILAGLLDDAPADMQQRCEDREPVASWMPPFYTGAHDAPAGLDGARCELTEPDEHSSTLHLVTRRDPAGDGYPDALCYLMTVTGSDTALEAYQGDVETWLASFELVDDRAADTVGRDAACSHSGGELREDGTYHNDRFGLHCDGPAHWHAAMRADGCLFGATWRCPANYGVLHVIGHPYPPGTREEQEQHVQDTVLAGLRESGLQVENSDWRTPTNGRPRELTIKSVPANGDGVRLDSVLLFQDLWVLIDGEIRSDAAHDAYQGLVGSLRR